MALGKGLNSLIPPKDSDGGKTRINVNPPSSGGASKTKVEIGNNDEDETNTPSQGAGFTTKKINADHKEENGGDQVSEASQDEGADTDDIVAALDDSIGVKELDINSIKDNTKQPRKDFNENKLNELADSIKQYGIIEPLVVSNEGGGKYEVVAGERRLKASRIAGIKKVPVVIKNVDAQERLEVALIENLQREDLNPIETAQAYKELMDDFKLSAEKVAKRVGKSRPKVSNTLRLLSLPSEIQDSLASGAINEGHAIYLLGIESPVKQMDMFRKITMNNWTVAETGKAVKKSGGTKHSQVKINMGDEEKQKELEDHLGTKVEIKRGRKGGKIIIEFYSDEELDGIVGKFKKG